MRVAAVDIGSYSVRLIIAEVKGRDLEILLERGAITSLAEGLKETGRLREERVKETLRVLKEYSGLVKEYRCDRVKAVATEALRRASNAEEFVELVRRETGFELEVISPEEEGRLAFLATAYSLRPEGFFLVVDQGGGSTEFVFGEDLTPAEIVSLPVGIVNLTERFIGHDPPLEEEVRSLREFVRERIKPLRRDVDEIVGLGGTITTVAALEYGVYPYDPRRIHGSELTLSALRRWLDVLVSLPARERSVRYRQIEDRRAEVIPAGIAMFVEILELFRRDTIRVGDWGVKHGLILSHVLSGSV